MGKPFDEAVLTAAGQALQRLDNVCFSDRRPVYIVTDYDDCDLPEPARLGDGTAGMTSEVKDLQLADWLRAKGAWRGRGPAIIMRPPSARPWDAWVGTLWHEAAHVLAFDPSYELASCSESSAMAAWQTRIDYRRNVQAGFDYHGPAWRRAVCYAYVSLPRVGNVGGLSVACALDEMAGDGNVYKWLSALGDDAKAVRDSQDGTFWHRVHYVAPPQAFVDLCRADGLDIPLSWGVR